MKIEDLKELIGALAAALTIIGAITFGALRVAYERFYDEFGIAPEDVGVDAARVVSQSAAGLSLGLAVFLLPGGLLLLVAARRERADTRQTGAILAVVATVGAALIFFDTAADADDAGRCAARADGQSVRSIRLKVPLGPSITLLGVRAERAVVRDLDPKVRQPWDGRRVVYLGTQDGTTILFDPATEETLRIPASVVSVAIDTTVPRFRKAKGCQPAGS